MPGAAEVLNGSCGFTQLTSRQVLFVKFGIVPLTSTYPLKEQSLDIYQAMRAEVDNDGNLNGPASTPLLA
jgi:hypothetical protein